MKNIIVRSIYFFLFFSVFTIVVNSVFLIVMASTDWDFMKRIESLRFESPDYDLLVLGSSLAQYGIDTELLSEKGINSYNLALTGSSVKTNYIQLKEYLDRYCRKPRYVILAVNAYLEQFSQDGIQPVVEFTMKGQKINYQDVPVSKFGWQLQEILKKIFSGEHRSGYISYGQIKRSKIIPDNSKFSEEYLNIQKYESAYWVGELAKLCHTNNIELIIVEIPGVKETQNLSEPGSYNISFKNGSHAILYNLNSKDFCDFIDANKHWCGLSHFNKFGATRFTEELIINTPLCNFLSNCNN